MFSYKEAYGKTIEYFNGDDLKTTVFLRKYAAKTVINGEEWFFELSPEDTFKRIAKRLYELDGGRYGYSYEDYFNLINRFEKFVFGGSIVASLGLDDEMSSVSNCFVIASPADSIGGIYLSEEEQIQLMKRRGGVGKDLSLIRGKGEKVNNSSKYCDGVKMVAKSASNATGGIAQEGRRGALMLSLNANHKDAEVFIEMKLDKKTCTNANISVKAYDDFMRASLNEGTKEAIVMDKIVKSSYNSAEPGVLFWDTILRESPLAGYGVEWEETSTNPCGELPLCPYDSCRLGHINVFSHVKNKFQKDAYLDIESIKNTIELSTVAMDLVVDEEINKIGRIIDKIKKDPEDDKTKAVELNLWEKILQKAKDGRRLGIGHMGIADAMAACGVKYGTKKGTSFAVDAQIAISYGCYGASIANAELLGACPLFDTECDNKSAFLVRNGLNGKPRRNIGLNTIAPTGTTSMMAGVSSGIEPVFKVFYERSVKTPNGEFIDAVGERFKKYIVVHDPFKEWAKLNNFPHETLEDLESAFKISPWFGATSHEVDYQEKVKMQGQMQQYIDHSISVTVNLKEDIDIKEVKELFYTAWRYGCKGLTIYRDKTLDGVLNSVGEPSKPLKKRPKTLKGEIHCFKIAKENWVAFVGLLNDSPYEVFIGKHDKNQFFSPKGGESGCINKIDGSYEFEYKDEMGYSYSVKGLENKFNKEYHNIAILVSSMLRGGFGVVNVIEAVEKMSDEDIIASFKNGLNRVLKKYIKDGEKPAGEKVCSQCKSSNLAYKDGCLQCLNCGDSKCS